MKYFITSLRIFLGLVFIASGILKLLPIEAFEATLFQQIPFVGWTLACIATRLFIIMELTLGVLLIANVQTKRLMYPFTLFILIFFTLFLIYALIRYGNQPNCGCFGELLPFTNVESLIKNIFLIAITIFLLKKSQVKPITKFNIIIMIVVVIVFSLAVFLTNKIIIYDNEIIVDEKEKIEANYINNVFVNANKDTIKLTDKHLIVFLSPKCYACQNIVKELQTINNVYNIKNIFLLIKADDKDDINYLFHEKKPDFPYLLVPRDSFDVYRITNVIPTLAYVENNNYKVVWTSRSFNIDKFIKFLKNNDLVNE